MSQVRVKMKSLGILKPSTLLSIINSDSLYMYTQLLYIIIHSIIISNYKPNYNLFLYSLTKHAFLRVTFTHACVHGNACVSQADSIAK